jgi:3-methyladenine DNA glycosylase/8-oxoguanine DNA glycosylase
LTSTRSLSHRDSTHLPVELRVELTPVTPFRLPRRGSGDGLVRARHGVLHRLLHHEGEPVLVRAAQTAADRVLLGASANNAAAAKHGIERMRFALGIDVDVRAFHRLFREDPAIGASVRRRPWLRTLRRPEPFEALMAAICQQLIEYERAVAIERKLIFALGRNHDCGDLGVLRDAPTSQALASAAPALLQSFDLAGSRALALVRAARHVATGRIELHDRDHERGWRRLRTISGIGPWTVEMLAINGQGREDQVPAGDLGLLKRVGRALSGGDPRVYADEAQVREFFAPYGRWAGLAALHVLTG